jgi:DNA-binding transcriptional ArsR family regulator
VQDVQAVFDALAEPNRRAILGLLARQELSVGELESRLELPQPLISKHLRVLRERGFVEARVEAQLRVYRALPALLDQASRRARAPSRPRSRRITYWRAARCRQ